jgi:hypothetical protein
MTRTVAADAAMSACPRAVVAVITRPVAAGTAIAFTGSGPKIPKTPKSAETPRTRRPGRPGGARTPLLCHLPGAPYQPELTYARRLGRLPVPGNAVTPAGWPADPGRDV